jgi:hypothetical protein
MLMVFLTWGCHSSFNNPDGSDDSGTDPAVDTAVDSHSDPGPDPVTDPSPPPPSGYALHEWGVMVMGPDGAVFHGSGPEYGGPVPAKPIIYLYAEEAFDLDVAVHFASGAPTETWPEAPLTSTLLWEGLRVEPGPCSPTPFPSPYDDPEGGFCEACTLSLSVVEEASCVTYGGQVARLLFYTGRLPGYEAPLEVESYTFTAVDGSEQVAFELLNDSGRTVRGVWLVYRDTTDSCIDPSACPVVSADIAWSYIDEVGPSESLALSLPILHFEAELDEYGYPIPGTLGLPAEWEDLGEDLDVSLQAQGLTAAESHAFMNAWDTVLFGLMGSDAVFLEPLYQNGSSVAYFMDRADYDEHLVLETSSPADEVVRVGMVYEQL